jgi:TldD protein
VEAIVKERLLSALSSATADYAEIRWETNDHTSAAYRGKEMDSVGSSRYEGGIVRACVKGGWGMAVFDTMDDLPARVAEACANAALVGHETTELAPTQAPKDEIVRAKMVNDFRGIPLDDKLALIGSYNDIILKADDAIQSTMVAYSENFRTVHFASTDGAYFSEERPRIVLYLMGIGRDGSLVQRASESFSSATDYHVVLGHEALAEEVGQRAARLLKAPQCKAGPQTVVLRPDFAGVFAHEAFGHLSEADFLYENPKMRDLMALGREMGVKDLNIIDDGSLAGRTGTLSYDDEGTPTGKTMLIENGVLAGHLHSRETAAKMGEKPTGNARAIGRGYDPIVRMTNTYIDAGPLTRDELFAGVDDGIYCCGMIGGQTMMEMFTFSAAYGYRIKNGQLGEMVRDIVLTGNVFETLHRIDGIADDLEIRETGGGCGKGGQSPLPVTFGGPHVRVQDVVVGGN